METKSRTKITVQSKVNAPIQTVWDKWSDPDHITKWCQASDDWHAPKAENDLREGGRFVTTMAAKDGSASFDFGGQYTKVENYKRIEYRMDDGRTVQVTFEPQGNATHVTETFEAEDQNAVEMQRGGWQAILDNFKKHVEGGK